MIFALIFAVPTVTFLMWKQYHCSDFHVLNYVLTVVKMRLHLFIGIVVTFMDVKDSVQLDVKASC